MMIRFLCLSVCVLVSLLLGSGCATITGSIIDPETPPPAIKTEYPYSFYVSSIQFCRLYADTQRKIFKYADEQTFLDDIRRKLASLYPFFVNEPNDTAIPIDYEIVFLSGDFHIGDLLFLSIGCAYGFFTTYSLGLLPVYIWQKRKLQVHAKAASKITAFCQREMTEHNRWNMGPLGIFKTRKLLPDFSDKDLPMMEEIPDFSREITSSECSIRFLNLFVYALQALDHKQIQQLYNEKYHPKVDFILP